jgi:ribosomal protein S18 acetylase RimI-like enzyme
MIEYKLYSEIGKDYEIADGFFEDWPDPPDKTEHKRIMVNSFKTVVATDSDKKLIIGFLNIISDGVLSAYIPLFEIVPEYRGRGIGRRLFEKALEETQDLYMLDLSCDDDMTAFYEKFGMMKGNAMIKRNYDRQSGQVRERI